MFSVSIEKEHPQQREITPVQGVCVFVCPHFVFCPGKQRPGTRLFARAQVVCPETRFAKFMKKIIRAYFVNV